MFLDLLESNTIRIDRPDGFDLWSSRAIATYLRLPESGYRTVASIRKERELNRELSPGAIPQQPFGKAQEPPKKLLEAIPNGEAYTNDPAPPIPFPDPITPVHTNPNDDPIAHPPTNTNHELVADHLNEPTIELAIDLVNAIEYLTTRLHKMNNSQIAELKAAIDKEETRRLTAILGENT
jgi:hypothetical protein